MRLSFSWLNGDPRSHPTRDPATVLNRGPTEVSAAQNLLAFEGAEAIYREAGVVACVHATDIQIGSGSVSAVATLAMVPGLSPAEVWGRAYTVVTGTAVPTWALARFKSLERFRIGATWDIFSNSHETWRASSLGWTFYFNEEVVSRVKAEAALLPTHESPSESLNRLVRCVNRWAYGTPAQRYVARNETDKGFVSSGLMDTGANQAVKGPVEWIPASWL